jgi:hypothetical protein
VPALRTGHRGPALERADAHLAEHHVRGGIGGVLSRPRRDTMRRRRGDEQLRPLACHELAADGGDHRARPTGRRDLLIEARRDEVAAGGARRLRQHTMLLPVEPVNVNRAAKRRRGRWRQQVLPEGRVVRERARELAPRRFAAELGQRGMLNLRPPLRQTLARLRLDPRAHRSASAYSQRSSSSASTRSGPCRRRGAAPGSRLARSCGRRCRGGGRAGARPRGLSAAAPVLS